MMIFYKMSKHYQKTKHLITQPMPSNRSISSYGAALGLSDLKVLGVITNGLSGNDVYWVSFSSGRGDSIKYGVLKRFTDVNEGDFTEELNRHQQSRDSWLNVFISESLTKYKEDLLILSPCPVRPTTTDPNNLLLYKNMRTEIGKVRRVSEVIGSEVKKAMGDSQVTFIAMSPAEAIQALMKHWPSAEKEGVWSKDHFWNNGGLPSCKIKSVVIGRNTYWNPVFLLKNANAELVGNPFNWRSIFQHGDLHPFNIICKHTGDKTDVRFIDFEKAGESSAFLDLCWLALWYLKEYTQPEGLHDVLLSELTEALYLLVLEGEMPKDKTLGAYDACLEAIKILFEPFEERTLKESIDIRLQLKMTMAGAALAMSYYEVRGVRKSIDKYPNNTADKLRLPKRCAALFFAISARFLDDNDIVAGTPDGDVVNLNLLWESDTLWQGNDNVSQEYIDSRHFIKGNIE